MTPKKQKKVERIRELERKLLEAQAQQIHRYHFASHELEKMGTTHCMGSAVIITFTVLGGRTTIAPVAIRDGLSETTINALQEDMRRSFDKATEFEPKRMDRRINHGLDLHK